MKTQDSKCNPSVTMTVTCMEAMQLWRALEHLERSHRKPPLRRSIGTLRNMLSPREMGVPRAEPDDGKWGHYDCPPRIKPLLAVIKGSIHAEHPELFETCFGYKSEDYKPTVNNAPIPSSPVIPQPKPGTRKWPAP